MTSLLTALAQQIKTQVEADDDLAAMAHGCAWFEDDLPNKEKQYPQVTFDTSYSLKIENKVQYHEEQYVYVSVWFENGIAAARNAELLSEGIMMVVHQSQRDGVWICAETRQCIRDPDTRLGRWRMLFCLQRVSAA